MLVITRGYRRSLTKLGTQHLPRYASHWGGSSLQWRSPGRTTDSSWTTNASHRTPWIRWCATSALAPEKMKWLVAVGDEWTWIISWRCFFIPGWFGTFFNDFTYIGNNNNLNWRTHIFQRGRYTTKQYTFQVQTTMFENFNLWINDVFACFAHDFSWYLRVFFQI